MLRKRLIICKEKKKTGNVALLSMPYESSSVTLSFVFSGVYTVSMAFYHFPISLILLFYLFIFLTGHAS
jgi:hypothetical protein